MHHFVGIGDERRKTEHNDVSLGGHGGSKHKAQHVSGMGGSSSACHSRIEDG